MTSVYLKAQQCLLGTVVEEKLRGVACLVADWKAGKLTTELEDSFVESFDSGVPAEVNLVKAAKLKPRSLEISEGHATLIHAILHVEFSAINLALDAVVRFREMPKDYIDDWLKVAAEECYHFSLLQERLEKMGYSYGDFPAHGGLWRTAFETADDVMVRMALVPRVLEARGLDVTPRIVEKLKGINDLETVDILAIIFRDEIIHVAAGTKWFRYECDKRRLEPDATFEKVVKERFYTIPRGPFHHEARIKAGFSEQEIFFLKGL